MPKRLSSSLWGLTVLCLTFCLTPSNAAQLAASIEYETIARPADVPGDLQPLPGASLRFLSIKAIDGFLVQAALWQPEAKAPAETTLIVMVHGSGGNYARAPNSTLGRSLSGNGFAALAINTRQHDDKRNTDNFLDPAATLTPPFSPPERSGIAPSCCRVTVWEPFKCCSMQRLTGNTTLRP
jgi:hypothetical protein